MEVVLRVIEGPEQGREFRFQEADNLLVGRQDPTSQADLNVSPDDEYVSRHHFTLEVRPPNCMIRDYHSTNGTFIRRRGRENWEKIEEALVYDGDHIKIGHTLLAVSMVQSALPGATMQADNLLPSQARSTPPGLIVSASSAARPELLCIRCGEKPLERQLELGKVNLRETDFMCAACRSDVALLHQREAEREVKTRYHCFRCQRDVTQQANADGLAATLAKAALYLCPDCAEDSRELSRFEIGGYHILKKLGQGSIGVVYEAWHPQTGRLAMLKQILPIAKSDSGLNLRFVHEISRIGTLKNEGVARLYEVGQEGKNLFFVSEYVQGGSVSQYVSEEGEPLLSPSATVGLMVDALSGLAFMHERGYVHRGLKPENILLQPIAADRVKPKLADFGLAHSYEEHGGTITRVGEHARAIMYMSPEQILSFKRAKPSADIYAMGVILYYLLTAHYPLDFPNPAELRRGARLTKDPARMILEDLPKSPSDLRRDLPPKLCVVVEKAVMKDPAQRFQSALEFQVALQAIGDDLNPPR